MTNSTQTTMKKGRTSWTPGNLGDLRGKEDGYRYRRVRKDDDNIAKKQEEGWEFVNATNSPKTKAVHPEGRPDEPNQMGSTVGGRDWVAMRMDEDTGKLRDEYINGKTERMTKALYRQTQDDMSGKAPIHGSITMEKRGVKTVIKD